MNERDRGHMFDGEAENETNAPPLADALRARVRSIKNTSERRNIVRLARKLGNLPTERGRAALEVGAALAGVSLRVSIEFLRAAPDAARLLDADALRQWGEWGRRISVTETEAGAEFFRAGVESLTKISPESRSLLLQICARQTTLSSSIALDTFRRAPALAEATEDSELLRRILQAALEIARRSAKHSADFLAVTPRALTALSRFAAEDAEVARSAVRLIEAFAVRAGGVGYDAWAAMPSALDALDARAARQLLDKTEKFLERGGAIGLHILTAGGEVLRRAPEAFEEWSALLEAVSIEGGNAGLVSLARATPAFFQALTVGATERRRERAVERIQRVLRIAREVAGVDAEAAILCFRSAPTALRGATIEGFEHWARYGLTHLTTHGADARMRRSYYGLETRHSAEILRGGGVQSDDAATKGLSLEQVAGTLRLYVEGLTGRAVEIAPLAVVPTEARIGDGRTIHLPSIVAEFGADDLDFRLYKVLAAHAAGQIEFGTHEQTNAPLQAAYAALYELYGEENRDALDAFALSGYINDPAKGEQALAPEEEARRAEAKRKRLPSDADYRAVLAVFPEKRLAARIFGTLENGRIDWHLRRMYRGLARDLDFVREHLRARRPRIVDLPITLVPFELLFQITLCGGALPDARQFYGQIISELEGIVADYLTTREASVADTLMATNRVYQLFASIAADGSLSPRESIDDEELSDEQTREPQATREATDVKSDPQEQLPQPRRDARDLFSAWANTDLLDQLGDEFDAAEAWTHTDMPEQQLEAGEVAFMYDEWDRELMDARVDWCRVVEKRVRLGDRSFVELTRSRYRGLISSIRHQFQLMRPEGLKRVSGETDGDDFDLNAVVTYVSDRRAARRFGSQPSERIYTKRLRRERDTAVAFLLDQSSSTARTMGRHPLQPYTHPGRRIIEIEKEGLVLMSEALEAVGDAYAIYGFTSEGRRNVRFYVVKDFNENYTEEIERRIGGINYQHNTRLGAAVRHAAARLLRQAARTRLLVILSDGRPYDHDYGDARYAREDTREALRGARIDGITPFCITIDRDSEAELRDLYGDVGYTIIDDVLSLPERMPAIYRRLTT